MRVRTLYPFYLLTGFVLFFALCTQLLCAECEPDASITIPMRDGTELPTDIYLPKNAFSSAPPCILLRTPSGRKSKTACTHIPLTKAGYCVVIQETRSAIDSKGQTIPYWNDGWGNHQDGFDTVEWLAKSPYSNGKIGTLGASGLGITQLLMAPTAPPGLKCQYIGMAPASLYHDATFPGGQLLKNQIEGWFKVFGKDAAVRDYICNQPIYNEFWSRFDTTKVADRVTVPAIFYTGWYDTFLQGTINAYLSRQENGGEGARGTQKLFIGPWTHFWPSSMKLGDFDIPKQAQQAPIDLSPQRWFDYYLKGIPNGIEHIPNITYYVMGPLDGSNSSGNVWRHADSWPVPSVLTHFYLTEDYQLAANPNSKESRFSYEFDPNNLVPTIGGRNLFIESGAKDQRQIEQRKDVVVFTTSPMSEDMEVTGNITAKLYIACDKPEADVVVRLTDVYPDGRSILIADGLLHLDHLTLNQTQEAIVDLWSTSIVFAKGHRIRISISGSNFPRYEKCLRESSTGIINNILFVGSDFPSQVILPVVRRES